MSLGQNTYMEQNIFLENAETEVDFENLNCKRAFVWRLLRGSNWNFRFPSRLTYLTLNFHVLKGGYSSLYKVEGIELRVMAAV
jgi:hypothetical protein